MTAWLDITGADVAGQVGEKQRLFETHRADVIDALPGSQDACAELLEAVRAAGVPVPVAPDVHPLEVIGRAVPEDFCVHLPGPDDRLVLVAGCGEEKKPEVAPVKLSVDAPADMALLRDESVEVHGIVSPRTAAVLVEGKSVSVRGGRFSTNVPWPGRASIRPSRSRSR